MFNLSAPRNEVRCGYKWDKELKEYVDTGRGCGQWIFLEKQRDGKWKITNSRAGRGGAIGEAHKCHNTNYHEVEPLNMRKYNYNQQNMPCGICGKKFNHEFYPLCPNCFRRQCRKCNNLQHWIDSFKTTGEANKCNVCGNDKLDVRQVFWAYMQHG